MRKAADILTRDVITVTPNTLVTEVARVLNDNGISGCPVVDVMGHLRGIVSRTNLLDHALRAEGGSLTPVLRMFIPGADEDEDVYALLGDDCEVPEVQDVMTSDVITVTPEATVIEVAKLMSEERIHRVPVVVNGRLEGIITSLDLLGVLSSQGSTT